MSKVATETKTVNGIRSPVMQAGAPDQTESVVFVHGNPGPATDWAGLLTQVGEFTRAVAPDMPGYRASPVSLMRGPIEALRQLDRPALVLWGSDDVYLPWRLAERQLTAFPSARIELLEGLGHWPFHEDPARVAELVLPFLRAHLGVPAP